MQRALDSVVSIVESKLNQWILDHLMPQVNEVLRNNLIDLTHFTQALRESWGIRVQDIQVSCGKEGLLISAELLPLPPPDVRSSETTVEDSDLGDVESVELSASQKNEMEEAERYFKVYNPFIDD